MFLLTLGEFADANFDADDDCSSHDDDGFPFIHGLSHATPSPSRAHRSPRPPRSDRNSPLIRSDIRSPDGDDEFIVLQRCPRPTAPSSRSSPARFPRAHALHRPLSPSTFVRGTNNRLARRFARRLNPSPRCGGPRTVAALGVPGTNSKYDFVSTTVTRRFPRKSRAICDPANPPPRITVRLATRVGRAASARRAPPPRRDERERERQAARGHGRRGAGRGRFGAIDDDGDAVAEPARGGDARASVDFGRARGGRGRRASRPTRETTERDARRRR